MIVDGKPRPKEFYLESEWRYVPRINGVPLALVKEYYEDETIIKKNNDILKSKAPLRFEPDDVRYIFVKSDADILLLVDFMNSQLGHLSHDAMKILTTRITSLEQIAKDI